MVETTAAGSVVATASELLFELLVGVYESLGFAELDDEVFRDLVIARVVEPTSLLDVGRVLADMGRQTASYPTLWRTLRRAARTGDSDISSADVGPEVESAGASGADGSDTTESETEAARGSYRDRIADLCFAHAMTCGDVSLVLYDVSVRHEALVVRVGVRDHHRGLLP